MKGRSNDVIASDLYALLYRLEYLVRYSNVPRIHDETVASHSFFVAVIVMALHEQYDFDLGKALQIALCHDIPEVVTNDLSHETKKRFPMIKEVMRKIEEEIVEDMPPAIQEGVKLHWDDDSVEALVVKYADVIQCYQYSSNEVSLGNSGYMDAVLRNSMARMNQYHTDPRLAGIRRKL